MATGKVVDCGRIRKERSENGRLWSEERRVRNRMNSVGGEQTADGSAWKRAKMGEYGVKGKG